MAPGMIELKKLPTRFNLIALKTEIFKFKPFRSARHLRAQIPEQPKLQNNKIEVKIFGSSQRIFMVEKSSFPLVTSQKIKQRAKIIFRSGVT